MAYDDNFVEQLTEFIPHLKKAQFAGGEPFLIKVYHQIWEKIIELSPDCIIGVQTNGTILNDTVRSLLNRGNFQVGVSLDSLQKDTYESIRKNASYDDVMQNIRYFTEYSKNKNIPMHITVCPMRINWKELPALVEFCNVLNVFIRFNTVWKPAQYALWNLPPDELKEICNYLFDKKPVGNNPVSKKNSRYYSGYINQINSWYEDGLSRQTEIEKIESISVD
jgi:MoaA/NifB/PqqE/SkfB family radical SAM enzyme